MIDAAAAASVAAQYDDATVPQSSADLNGSEVVIFHDAVAGAAGAGVRAP